MKQSKKIIFFILLILLLPQYLLAAEKKNILYKIKVVNTSSEIIKAEKDSIVPKASFKKEYTSDPTLKITAKDGSEICTITAHADLENITNPKVGNTNLDRCYVPVKISGHKLSLTVIVKSKDHEDDDLIIISPDHP